jgi:hypothetical protein
MPTQHTPTHTPGPWHAGSASGGQGLVTQQETGTSIAVTFDAKNRHLVAAAPEMLEALKDCKEALFNLRSIEKWDHPNYKSNDHTDEAVDAMEKANYVIHKFDLNK